MSGTLPLQDMDKRHVGLSHPVAECYLEAARVCLDRHYSPPQEFVLHDNSDESKVWVEWEQADGRSKAAWANNDDATRDGAYACALAATEYSRGLVAVSRAETHTGADYYVAPAGQTLEDLEDCYRLEVSGTHLDFSGVKTRLKVKIEQALRGSSNLPALAAVVGFRARIIMIQTVES
jgi:hypothetical protein